MAPVATEVVERFLYHSFPRRGRGSDAEIEKGCKVLSLIREAGLLLTPEIVPWQHEHADGTPPRQQQVIQKRACFTELSPAELPTHAEEFGHFALEFQIDTLKTVGAIPVFYIPQPSDKSLSLGSTLVIQVIDAMLLVMKLVDMKKGLDSFPTDTGERMEYGSGFQNPKVFNLDVTETRRTLDALTHALTPPDMLEHALIGLMNFFYPADDVPRNKALAYYRQREWRIAGNFSVRGNEVMRRPSPELIDRLLAIDEEFFGREFSSPFGNRLADAAYVYPGFGDRKVLEMSTRVIVPAAAVDKAKKILNGLDRCPPVVSLESIANPKF
jgi:hypothetical protein